MPCKIQFDQIKNGRLVAIIDFKNICNVQYMANCCRSCSWTITVKQNVRVRGRMHPEKLYWQGGGERGLIIVAGCFKDVFLTAAINMLLFCTFVFC